jgi:adenylate cyclase
MERRDTLAYFPIATLVALLIALSYSISLWSSAESRIEDTFFATKNPNTPVVVLAIDDESLAHLGQWPWPRDVYAKLLLALNKNPPSALALDVLLSEPSRLGQQDDASLANALNSVTFPVILGAEAKNIILSKNLASTFELIEPETNFKNANTSLGIVNVISDRDGIVRTFPLSTKYQETPYQALALEAVSRAQLLPSTTSHVGTTRIVYSGNPENIRTIPLYRLLEKDPPTLKGSVVFVGATAPSLRDSEKTPLSPSTPGVYIHASIANMLLQGLTLTPLSQKVSLLCIFLIAYASTILFLVTRRVVVAVLLNLLFGSILLLLAMLLFEKGVVINIMHLTLAWLLTTITHSLYKSLRSENEKQLIKQTFSKYVSGHVLDTLLANPKNVKLGGEEREITVLFSDIRGFTTLSEGLEPTELVTLLNRYFKAVTKEIIDNDGVLDKYIGDAIMAFWGAPIDDPLQASKAVRAAKGMLQELHALNEELKSEGKPVIAIGIGIYSGRAVVGNVGSDIRFDYTAIGDTVNAASRLEGLTKEYNAKIIIGESTKKILHDTEGLQITALGGATVKGKKESITIYSVE